MQDNRNTSAITNCDGRGTVCINTRRVLDSCKDRDCFEDVRVYLTARGEEMLSIAQNIRVKSAKINSAYVGVSDVPFNDGFYRITVKYYVVLELEGCVAIGRSETFGGLVVLEKDVILYGGKGSTTSYTSSVDNNYCATPEPMNVHCDLPVAVVETVCEQEVNSCVVPCEIISRCGVSS